MRQTIFGYAALAFVVASPVLAQGAATDLLQPGDLKPVIEKTLEADAPTIVDILGIYQEGKHATVYMKLTMKNIDSSIDVKTNCYHLNDGRWYCDDVLHADPLVLGFFIEK